jgi:DNA-directed RNA polymerase specialized sigma24 family protein
MNSDAKQELERLGSMGLRELMSALRCGAYKIAQRKRWSGANPLGTVAGLDDFVSCAFSKVLEGKRPWRSNGNVSLRAHLFGCLRSEIDNLSKRRDNTMFAEKDVSLVASCANDNTPEKLVLCKEWGERFLSRVRASCQGDLQLLEVVNLWVSGYEKASEIAEVLKEDPEEIHTRIRKIRRRLSALEPSDVLSRSWAV